MTDPDAPPPVITIRPGRAIGRSGDPPRLAGIAKSVGELHKMVSTADDLRRHGFGRSPAFETLIAEVDGEIAGLCLFFAELLDLARPPGRLCAGSLRRRALPQARHRPKLIRHTAALVRATRRRLSPAVRRHHEFRRAALLRPARPRPFRHRADPRRLWRGVRQRWPPRAEESVMKAFFADEQRRHDPKAFLSSGAPQPNPEKPERVERLLAGARAAGCTIERPRDDGLGPIAAVHTPEYIDVPAAHLRSAGSASRAPRPRSFPTSTR